LIALCLAGSLILLGVAWQVGDASSAAQERQWQLVFVGLSLALAGQWIVGGSPQARKHQIAATCLVMALAGYGIQRYYELPFSQLTPFLVGYGFLFAAAELCALVGALRPTPRRAIHMLRFAVVAWNVGWAGFFALTSYGALPDVASLYIAFSLLWTVATAVIAWSEFCTVAAAEAEPAHLPPHGDVVEFLAPAE
jgi:hypothetical protein